MMNENNYLKLKQYLCMLRATRLNRTVVINNRELIYDEFVKVCINLVELISIDRTHPTQTFMENRSIVSLDELREGINETIAKLKDSDDLISRDIIFTFPVLDPLVENFVKRHGLQTEIRHTLASLFNIHDDILNECRAFINYPDSKIKLKQLIIKINAAQSIDFLLDISETGERFQFMAADTLPLISQEQSWN